MPSKKSIDVGVVSKTFDLIAFVPMSMDAIFIMCRRCIL